MQKIPLTVRGAELLKQELQHLKSVARPEVIEAIAEARSHGDLSENAEYEAAKERQGFIEGRIAELEHKLSMAHIINPAEIHAEGKIVFGTTVTLEDLETEEQVTYQIVGEDEADIKERKIYVGSPIARALIGKEEGDVAEVQAPGGVRDKRPSENIFRRPFVVPKNTIIEKVKSSQEKYNESTVQNYPNRRRHVARYATDRRLCYRPNPVPPSA